MNIQQNLETKEAAYGGLAGGILGAVFTLAFGFLGSCCCCIFQFGSPIAAFLAGMIGGFIAIHLMKDKIKNPQDPMVETGINGGFAGLITGIVSGLAGVILPAIISLLRGVVGILDSEDAASGIIGSTGSLIFAILIGIGTILLGILGGILGGIIGSYFFKDELGGKKKEEKEIKHKVHETSEIPRPEQD